MCLSQNLLLPHTKASTAPFHTPFPQSPSSPGMKPGWPKSHPWLSRHRQGEGNQPPHHQKDPEKMLKLVSWGLHPRKGFLSL